MRHDGCGDQGIVAHQGCVHESWCPLPERSGVDDIGEQKAQKASRERPVPHGLNGDRSKRSRPPIAPSRGTETGDPLRDGPLDRPYRRVGVVIVARTGVVGWRRSTPAVLESDAYAGSTVLLTIHACLPTWRPRVKPYCSNSSTVALNRNRPGASRPAVISEMASTSPPPRSRDLLQRALQGGAGDALPAVLRVDVEAGDPPVRPGRRVLVVLAPVLDARQFLGAAVLAPALRGAVLVDHERGVGAIRADAILLDGAMADTALPALRVDSRCTSSRQRCRCCARPARRTHPTSRRRARESWIASSLSRPSAHRSRHVEGASPFGTRSPVIRWGCRFGT